jgi:hypothetical protein
MLCSVLAYHLVISLLGKDLRTRVCEAYMNSMSISKMDGSSSQPSYSNVHFRRVDGRWLRRTDQLQVFCSAISTSAEDP